MSWVRIELVFQIAFLYKFFYFPYLNKSFSVAHLDHIKKVHESSEFVGIGADYDGVDK